MRMSGDVPGIISYQLLVAGAVLAFISLLSIIATPLGQGEADMYITPDRGVVRTDEQFTVALTVNSRTPVNVFKGELRFDPAKLAVVAIDYNTSLADLWAEKPWYENGAGTINFIGGTTLKGGFLGTGTLLVVTFESRASGEATISVADARILAHDGLGSDVPLGTPLDALFHVEPTAIDEQTVATPNPEPAEVAIVPESSATDLNGDGVQTIADVSVFMVGMVSGDSRLDFNGDGSIGAADLSIIMSVPRE